MLRYYAKDYQYALRDLDTALRYLIDHPELQERALARTVAALQVVPPGCVIRRSSKAEPRANGPIRVRDAPPRRAMPSSKSPRHSPSWMAHPSPRIWSNAPPPSDRVRAWLARYEPSLVQLDRLLPGDLKPTALLHAHEWRKVKSPGLVVVRPWRPGVARDSDRGLIGVLGDVADRDRGSIGVCKFAKEAKRWSFSGLFPTRWPRSMVV